jgi:hypothetical protein
VRPDPEHDLVGGAVRDERAIDPRLRPADPRTIDDGPREADAYDRPITEPDLDD